MERSLERPFSVRQSVLFHSCNCVASVCEVSVLHPVPSVAAIREAGGVVLTYGLVINARIAFMIVAFVLYLVVKSMNRMQREEEAAAEPAPELSNEEMLLGEIRDLLKAQNA